ncbi:MAG TPA: hypothetical protein VKS21_04625 [Spirochaetota bacterium]|nr:hypothetical protein [Spirochaetota bacterium]
MKKITAYIFFLLSFLFFSCGTPNPLEKSSVLNPPFYTEIFSSNNNTLIFEITGLNSVSNAYDFDGYNIYYGLADDETEIMSNLMLNPYNNTDPLPTVPASFSTEVQTTAFVLSNNFEYSNKNGKEQVNITPHDIYYFIIESHSRKNTLSKQRHIILKQPAYTMPGEQISNATSYTYKKLALTFYTNFLVPDGNTEVQHTVLNKEWYRIQGASEQGYSKSAVPLYVSNIYMFKSTSGEITDYGLLYITAINNDINFILRYQEESTNL